MRPEPDASDAGASPVVEVDVDAEMEKHLRRLAQIDRIAFIARETHNAGLREKAMLLRQNELRRHLRVMSRVGKVALDERDAD